VVAPFFNLEPVMTTVVAAAILGERLAANQYAGGGLVLIALVLAGLQGKAKRMWLARPARSRP
jgi:drug/metabolite transporter (DMT)-like permease